MKAIKVHPNSHNNIALLLLLVLVQAARGRAQTEEVGSGESTSILLMPSEPSMVDEMTSSEFPLPRSSFSIFPIMSPPPSPSPTPPGNTLLAGSLVPTIFHTTPPPSTTPTPTPGQGGDSQLNIGLVAGASAGGGVALLAVVLLIVCCCCCCCVWRKKRRSDCYVVQDDIVMSEVRKLEMTEREEPMSDLFTLVPDATTGTFGVISNPDAATNENNNTETESRDNLPPLIFLNPILSPKRTSFGYDSSTLPPPKKSKAQTTGYSDVDFDSYGVKPAKSTGNISREALDSAPLLADLSEEKLKTKTEAEAKATAHVLQKQTSIIYDVPKTSSNVPPRSHVTESGGYVIISKNPASVEPLATKQNNPSASIYQVPSGIPAAANIDPVTPTSERGTINASQVEVPSHYDVPRKLLETLSEERKAPNDIPKYHAQAAPANSSARVIYDRPRIAPSPPVRDRPKSPQNNNSESEEEYIIPPDALFATSSPQLREENSQTGTPSLNELLSSNVFAKQRSAKPEHQPPPQTITDTAAAKDTIAAVKLSPVPKPRKLKATTSQTAIEAKQPEEMKEEERPPIPRKQSSISSLKQLPGKDTSIINTSSLAEYSRDSSQTLSSAVQPQVNNGESHPDGEPIKSPGLSRQEEPTSPDQTSHPSYDHPSIAEAQQDLEKGIQQPALAPRPKIKPRARAKAAPQLMMPSSVMQELFSRTGPAVAGKKGVKEPAPEAMGRKLEGAGQEEEEEEGRRESIEDWANGERTKDALEVFAKDGRPLIKEKPSGIISSKGPPPLKQKPVVKSQT